MDAQLRDIFLASAAGESMERRERAVVVPGGLVGDRYQRGEGHYQLDACEVTLVEQEALEQIHEAAGLDLSAGQHRRNLVTSGIELEALLEATFRIGDAVFRGTRRRPPCAYLDTVAEPPGYRERVNRAWRNLYGRRRGGRNNDRRRTRNRPSRPTDSGGTHHRADGNGVSVRTQALGPWASNHSVSSVSRWTARSGSPML